MGITTLLEEKAGAPRDPGPIGAYRALALSSLGDVLGLRSLLALAHLVGDLLSLLEVPEPAALYGGEVHEEVLAPVVGGYEPVALVLAEPLDRSLRHALPPSRCFPAGKLTLATKDSKRKKAGFPREGRE